MTKSSVQKTITLPSAIAERLEAEARRRKMSISAVVTELVSRQSEQLPYAGLIDDEEDLSLRVEKILARLER